MAEYITRDSALAFQCEVEPVMCKSIVTGEVFSATPDAALVKFFNALPAADVREVKRGKWVWNDQSNIVCSLCGNVVAFVSHPKKKWEAGYYCPNCGADMREEQT